MKALFKVFKSNDYLYWLYAKSMYNIQKFRDDTFEASKICENLWLGGITSVCNRDELKERNIELIITAVYGASASYPYDFHYQRSNLKDIEDENILPEIERLLPIIDLEIRNNRAVLVSCIMGRSRSASIVAAYLMKYKNMSLDTALKYIKEKRAQIDPNPSYLLQLKEFEKTLQVELENKKIV
jgi:hypothetical protein